MKNSDAGATFFFITSSPAFLKTFDFMLFFLHLAQIIGDPTDFRFISASALRGLLNARFEQSDDAACAADEVYGSRR